MMWSLFCKNVPVIFPTKAEVLPPFLPQSLPTPPLPRPRRALRPCPPPRLAARLRLALARTPWLPPTGTGAGPRDSSVHDFRAGGGASMACEGGGSGSGAVSEERRNGWRPVRARSSAPASRSMARDPAAELDILHGARPPARCRSISSSMARDPRPRPGASAGAIPDSTAAKNPPLPRARPRLRWPAGTS
jgi:hypothetical protein